MRNIAKLLFVLVFLSYQTIVFFTSDGLSGVLFSIGIGVFSFFLVFGVLWKPRDVSEHTKPIAKDEGVTRKYSQDLSKRKQAYENSFVPKGQKQYLDKDDVRVDSVMNKHLHVIQNQYFNEPLRRSGQASYLYPDNTKKKSVTSEVDTGKKTSLSDDLFDWGDTSSDSGGDSGGGE